MPFVTILLVEKEGLLLQFEELLFQRNGFQVLPAMSRPEAEQLLGSHKPDVVVLGHTLSRRDRELLLARSRLERPQPKLLATHAAPDLQPLFPHPDADVNTGTGARELLAVVHKLLVSRGSAPEERTVLVTRTRAQRGAA